MFRMFRIIFIYTCFIVRDVYTCKALFQTSKQPNASFEACTLASSNETGLYRKHAQQTCVMKPPLRGASKIAVEGVLSHAGAFLGPKGTPSSAPKMRRPEGVEI